ncbi:MAG: methyl-accepting chemotaxis protein, partial [Spirochaetes bacterium]|nr:methyl-accepting chemotaxis protein [Spirochaetota bacterium]
EIKGLSVSSVEVADRAGELINQIVPHIIKTADMVQEIASASREQKSGMSQLSSAATQQEQVTQMVSANSEELASTAEEMASQSQNLLELVSMFQVSDEHQTPERKKVVKNKTKQIKKQSLAAPVMEKKAIPPQTTQTKQGEEKENKKTDDDVDASEGYIEL